MRAVIILCLLAVCVRVAQAGYWNIGCYSDNEYYRRLPYFIYEGKELTIKKCIDLCKHAENYYAPDGYDYAGLTFGDQCFCGNGFPYGYPQPESECNYPCSGKASQICGGEWRITIYAAKMGYRGCFENSPNSPALPYLVSEGGYLTRIGCIQACHPYKYAGVEHSFKCYCGNIAPKFPAKHEDECDVNCSGAPYEKCGGHNRINVFRRF